MLTESEQARNWVYYQDLLKIHGFNGITSLLSRHERQRAEIERLRSAIQELIGDDAIGSCRECLAGESDAWTRLEALLTKNATGFRAVGEDGDE